MKELPSNSLVNEFISTVKVLFVFGLLLCAITWPLAFIWALNTLFGFSIEYTFWTWLATWILIFTFQGAINIKKERTINLK
jgi:hypothetical protein